MSAAPVFYVRSKVSKEHLESSLRAIWDEVLGFAYRSDVVVEESRYVSMGLNYFFGDPRETIQARKVIECLFTIAEGDIFYGPSYDGGVRPGENDYLTPVSVDDILTGHLYPGMFDGPQFCYRLSKCEPTV